MNRPKIKLSALREIGWKHWDPIGLAPPEDNSADEYDGYLLQAAGLIRNGKGIEAAAAKLVWAESENMGLGIGPTTRARATETAEQISIYLSTLP